MARGRRVGEDVPRVRHVDFNDLPRASRERFVRSLVSTSPTARPLCGRVAKRRPTVGWWLLVVAAVGALAALAAPRFGAIEAPVQDARYLAGYVAAWTALALAGSMLARRRALAGSLPFAPGVYVFPLDVVDARTRSLTLHPLADLDRCELVESRRKGVCEVHFELPAARFVFELAGRDVAEGVVAAVERARSSSSARGVSGDASTNDPFAEARARRFEPARDHGILARGRPAWSRHVWAIGLTVGVVGGGLSHRLRNSVSDRQALARVDATGDVELAERYAGGSGSHASEVAAGTLPRAHLARARSLPDGRLRADAIARVLTRFPRSPATADARVALALAEHAEFAKLRTVAELRAFVAWSPAAADAPAASAKIAEAYVRAREEFRARGKTTDKSVAPVVDAILRHAEASASVDVRLRRHIAPSLPAHLGASHAAVLEEAREVDAGVTPASALVAALERSLVAVFGAEVVSLRLGPPLDGPAPIPGTPPFVEVSAPVIVIDYELTPSAVSYPAAPAGASSATAFDVSFDLAVQVPGEPRTTSFETEVEAPTKLAFAAIDRAFAPLLPAGAASLDAASVETRLLARAFDQLAARWSDAFVESVDAAGAASARQP